MAARRSPIVGLLLLLLLPLVASSPPIALKLYGDVYPTGHFYVNISIGDPPHPYLLDIDTGSNFTWLECQPCKSCSKVPHMATMYRSTPDKLVPCTDRLCIDLHRDLGNSPNKCTKEGKCAYKATYLDGKSEGVLIGGDKFSLLRSGARPLLAFGCGHDQGVGQNFQVQSPVDGLLALGKGSVGLVSQLKNQGIITKNVISHCISIKGGGFLLVGDDSFTPGVTWVPMVQSRPREYHHYSPGLAQIYFDRNPLPVNPIEVVFDSGSTFTQFDSQPYKATLSAVKRALGDKLEPVEDPAEHVCWKGGKPFKHVADVKTFFKPLSLVFQHDSNKATMEIPPENYLIISENGNVCFGILDGSKLDLDGMNIIGDISMQDQLVIYDNEEARLGWVRYTRCDQMPTNEFVITSRSISKNKGMATRY